MPFNADRKAKRAEHTHVHTHTTGGTLAYVTAAGPRPRNKGGGGVLCMSERKLMGE